MSSNSNNHNSNITTMTTKTKSGKKKKQTVEQKGLSTTSTSNSNSTFNFDNLNLPSSSSIIADSIPIKEEPPSSPKALTITAPIKLTEPISIPKEFNLKLEFVKLISNVITIFNFLYRLLFSLISPTLPYLLPLLIVILSSWYSIHLIRNLLAPYFNLPSIPSISFLLPLRSVSSGVSNFLGITGNAISNLGSIARNESSRALSSTGILYCSIVGIGCGTKRREKREKELGGAAREVKRQALQALDIFQSVLSIGGGSEASLDLQHVPLWELATAVRYSSDIDNREFLGSQLKDLGSLTRDMKDEIIRLNSHGINSFTWILNEFSRLEYLIHTTSISSNPSLPHPELESLLQSLFSKMSTDLSELLLILDRAIPLADRAQDLGGKLAESFTATEYNLEKEKSKNQDWKRFLPTFGNDWKAQQVRKDLDLMGSTINNILSTRSNLEATRISLLSYSNNVGHFKAGLIGFHLAGHGLSAVEEVSALRNVMQDFRNTVEEAKSSSGRPISRRALPA